MKTVKKSVPKEILQKKSKIPYIFLAFFIVVVVVNVCYIYLSQKTWRGLVTKDSYHKGLNYNDTLKQVEDQKKLGWKVDVKYRISNGKGIITVGVLDGKAGYIKDAKIYANFRRPTQEGFDFAQEIPFKDGVYRGEIVFPLKGQWDAEIAVRRGEDVFVEVKRYIVQ